MTNLKIKVSFKLLLSKVQIQATTFSCIILLHVELPIIHLPLNEINDLTKAALYSMLKCKCAQRKVL